ncbi:MAG: shikimate dehydrogenase [Alphaproteobacteria bacterium]|nr:shikimate dehydrogenase [Alphaproteobacteria bacterium]
MRERYAVIGNPIEQSKSPFIHGEFARACGQQIEYDRILGPVGGFVASVDAFRAQGGLGMNVTAPFKLDACAYCTELSLDARLAGAVNAMKFEGKRVLGQNFDGVGLVRDLQVNLNMPLVGKRVLIVGAGGASRGALLPLLACAPAELVVVNRTLNKASELVDIARLHVPAQAQASQVQGVGYADLQDRAFDVVLHATSAGLSGQMPPLANSVFAPRALAYDLTYGKGLTPFLRLARDAGVSNLADGVGMLAEQAAEAFTWWRGVRPDTAQLIRQLTVPLT